MGKFARDYKEVELKEGEGYDGDQPKSGIYAAKLVSVADHTSQAGNEGTEWVFEITEPPYAGWRGYLYTNDDTSAWKEVQILLALGIISDPKGKVNTTHAAILKKASEVRVRTRSETYEDERRAKIRTVLPPGEDDDEDTGSKKASKKKGKKKKSDEDEPF